VFYNLLPIVALYLESLGYENVIIGGNYQKEPSSNAVSHFWLQLNDDLKTIVDTTIEQFEDNIVNAYVGPKKEAFSQIHEFEEWFDATYSIWKDKLLDQAYLNDLDITMLININLNAGTILYNQNQEKPTNKSGIYDDYFDCIFQVIRNYYNTNEWSQIMYPKNFNSLFTNVLMG